MKSFLGNIYRHLAIFSGHTVAAKQPIGSTISQTLLLAVPMDSVNEFDFSTADLSDAVFKRKCPPVPNCNRNDKYREDQEH